MTGLYELIPTDERGGDFLHKMCGGDAGKLLDGLSRLLVWYAHNSAGRHVEITHTDLESEYTRLPGAPGALMRALDPRTLAIVTHLTSRHLHTGDSVEQAIKRVIDKAYLAYCQIA